MAEPQRRAADRDPAAYCAWLSVQWAGPWERIATALAPGPRNPPAGRWRAALAGFCDRREREWLRRYAVKLRRPPDRWRRRSAPMHG